MPDSATVLERAIAFAVEKHLGQRDKAGQPYILHPLRLMAAMDSDDARVAAVLHDVVEDTDATFGDLAALGLSEASLAAVRLLTHEAEDGGGDAAYLAYVSRLARDPIARAVKLADLADNLDVRRIGRVDERDVARLNRYLRAREALTRAAKEAR